MERRSGPYVAAFAFASVLGGTLGGCGGGSDNGPIPTSVPGDKPLNNLTSTERDQLCADLIDFAKSGPLMSEGCNGNGWLAAYLQSLEADASDAELRTICEDIYAVCIANDGAARSMCIPGPVTCGATVAEFNACVVEGLAGFSGLPGCSAVTRASLAAEFAALAARPPSPGCVRLEMKCPTSGEALSGDAPPGR